MQMKTKTPKKKKTTESTSDKPLVKKFYDTEVEIIKHIKMMLPHVPQTTIQIKFLYKTANSYRYRVNYMNAEGRIPHSKYVNIIVSDKNKFDIVYS